MGRSDLSIYVDSGDVFWEGKKLHAAFMNLEDA